MQQAASALLSISSQDGLDTVDTSQPGGGEGEDSLDEHDDEVVFTSKGVFRVGDVDVDPKYNRIGIGRSFTWVHSTHFLYNVCADIFLTKSKKKTLKENQNWSNLGYFSRFATFKGAIFLWNWKKTVKL